MASAGVSNSDFAWRIAFVLFALVLFALVCLAVHVWRSVQAKKIPAQPLDLEAPDLSKLPPSPLPPTLRKRNTAGRSASSSAACESSMCSPRAPAPMDTSVLLLGWTGRCRNPLAEVPVDIHKLEAFFSGLGCRVSELSVCSGDLSVGQCLESLLGFFEREQAPLQVVAFSGLGSRGSGAWRLADGELHFGHLLDLWEAEPRLGELFVYSDSCHSGYLCSIAQQRKAQVFVQASCMHDELSWDGQFTRLWLKVAKGACSVGEALGQLAKVYHFDGTKMERLLAKISRRRSTHPLCYVPDGVSEGRLRQLLALVSYYAALEPDDTLSGHYEQALLRLAFRGWRTSRTRFEQYREERLRQLRLAGIARQIVRRRRSVLHVQHSVLQQAAQAQQQQAAQAQSSKRGPSTACQGIYGCVECWLSLADLLHYRLAERSKLEASAPFVHSRAAMDMSCGHTMVHEKSRALRALGRLYRTDSLRAAALAALELLPASAPRDSLAADLLLQELERPQQRGARSVLFRAMPCAPTELRGCVHLLEAQASDAHFLLRTLTDNPGAEACLRAAQQDARVLACLSPADRELVNIQRGVDVFYRLQLLARQSSSQPALDSLLLQAELQLGGLYPEGPFLTHCLGYKFQESRWQLAIDLTDPETRDGALQTVGTLRQQLSINQEEDDVERGPPVASDGQQTGATGPSSSASSEARSGRRGRRGRGRAARSGSGSGTGEEQDLPPAGGGNQQLCQDHVGLTELLLQERNSGRSLRDAAAEGFLTTRQLLLEQIAEEEPYHLPPDGGSSRVELDQARGHLQCYSLKEARAKDDSHREKIQVVVYVEGRAIFGDEQRRILRTVNVIFRARVGRRTRDGKWAKQGPELFLCPWKDRDEVVYVSEDEDDTAAPPPGKAGGNSTPSTRSRSGTRSPASSSTSNSLAPVDPEPSTFGRPPSEGEEAVGEPSALYPPTPESLSPRGPCNWAVSEL